MQRREEIANIVEQCRTEGYRISDAEIDEIIQHCIRKMEVAGIEDKEMYLPMLFEDELKQYLIRNAINAVTLLREIAKEAEKNVCFVQAEPMRQQMS